MKSGMTAAEAIFQELADDSVREDAVSRATQAHLAVGRALPGAQRAAVVPLGLRGAITYSALDTYVLRGRAPWMLYHVADHTQLKKASECRKIDYPKPDGVVSFDKLSSVFISNTNHEENQPCHLRLKDPAVPIRLNLALDDAPEQRYCSAGVYEIVREADVGNARLQINGQNCVHSKTCDGPDSEYRVDGTRRRRR